MKATLKIENAQGLLGSHRDAECKNGITTGYKAFAIIDSKPVVLADMRIAISKSGTPYACFWAYRPGGNGMWSNGSGTVCGYGYHKASAAAGKAIRSAGFSLSEDIDRCGDSSAIRDAVLAVGECLYTDGPVYIMDCNA